MVLLSACGGSTEGAGSGAEYVALGDSYTSGAGISPVADQACGRSEVDYPSLVAKAMKITSYADRSCWGATTDHLAHAQHDRLVQLNDPQLDAVGQRTRLVTLGIGLNDDGAASGLLAVCLTPAGGRPTPACESYLAEPQSAVEAALTKVADHVRTAVATIAEKAPEARIVLVGYPQLLPATGGCADRLPIPDAMISRLREGLRFVNEAWRQVAHDTGATYIDTYALSQGHDVCSDSAWIHGVANDGTATPLHPFAAYHQAVADAIVGVLE